RHSWKWMRGAHRLPCAPLRGTRDFPCNGRPPEKKESGQECRRTELYSYSWGLRDWRPRRFPNSWLCRSCGATAPLRELPFHKGSPQPVREEWKQSERSGRLRRLGADVSLINLAALLLFVKNQPAVLDDDDDVSQALDGRKRVTVNDDDISAAAYLDCAEIISSAQPRGPTSSRRSDDLLTRNTGLLVGLQFIKEAAVIGACQERYSRGHSIVHELRHPFVALLPSGNFLETELFTQG